MAYDIEIPGWTGQRAKACKTLLHDCLKMVVVTEKDIELGALIESVRHSLYRFETWTVSIRELYKTDLNGLPGPHLDGPRPQRDDLYSEVLRLLDELHKFLGDLMQILNGTRQQRRWVKSSINTPPDDMDISSSEDSDSEFADYIKKNELETADSETVTESNELCRWIGDTITSLMRITMQVDDSVLHSKFDFCRLKNADSVESDIMHVREKFPLLDCNHPLARKLGKANAQRRKWLESRRQDHFYGSPFRTYRYDSNLHAQTTSASYGNNNLSSSARATVNPDEVEHSRMNQEDAETTVPTATDFGGSSSVEIDEDESESLVPEPPEGLTPGKPFLCPYCYIKVEISNTTEWQRHVFDDLSSYTCTFDNCPAPLFETREQWFQHEMEVHRKNWRCDMCDEIHYSSWNMKRHLTHKHSDIIKAENVEAHTQRLGRPPEKIGAEACPLCDYKGTLQRRSGSKPSDWELTPQAFGNHLAKHLEELSLLVLPPTTANERKGKATTRLTDFNPSGTDMNSATGVTTQMRKGKTSAYNDAFEQLMIDYYSIYPPRHRFTDDPNATTPQPNNLEKEREVLSRRRPSLDSSRFTERDFQIFQRKNDDATTEVTVDRTVVHPFIAGSSDSDIRNAGNLPFSNLEPIAGEDVVKPKPDFFDGAHISAIHTKIKDANEDGNLSKLIIPTNNAPVLPNFFMEIKGPKGNALVAQRQAMHVGAIGARAIHAIQNHGKKEPVYDGNTYTYSSTYCNGTLNLYVHHVAPPTVPGGQPKYYMTLVNAWVLLTTSQTFREGVTAFRNARDRARWHRDNFIQAANERAHQSDGAAPPPEAGTTAAAGVTAQSGEATAETTAAAGVTAQSGEATAETTAAAGVAEQHDESTADDLGDRDDDAGSESTITSIGAEDYTVSQAVVDGEPAHSQQLLHQEHEPSQETTSRAIEPATSFATSLTSSLSQSQTTSGSAKRTRFADLLSNAGQNHDRENKRVRPSTRQKPR